MKTSNLFLRAKNMNPPRNGCPQTTNLFKVRKEQEKKGEKQEREEKKGKERKGRERKRKEKKRKGEEEGKPKGRGSKGK